MIAICSDHGGYLLKEKIKEYFGEMEFKDFGAYSTKRMDYTDVVFPLAESIISGECEEGIAICKTGIGMSIAANKVPGIRCALCYNLETAKLSKEHNNANVIAIGADMIEEAMVLKMIATWRESQFLGERYQERIEKEEEYRKKIEKR